MPRITHYYHPERAAKTYGNRPPCCKRPPEDHPPVEDGKTVRIRLTRNVSRGDLRKGQTFTATLRLSESFRIAKELRWGTNVLGQFAELERAELETVMVPDYTIRVEAGYLMAIPTTYAVEVPA